MELLNKPRSCHRVRHVLCTCRWFRALGLFHTGLHSGSSPAATRRCSDTAGRPSCCSLGRTNTLPLRSNCLQHSVKTRCRPGTYRGPLGQLKPTERRERPERGDYISAVRLSLADSEQRLEGILIDVNDGVCFQYDGFNDSTCCRETFQAKRCFAFMLRITYRLQKTAVGGCVSLTFLLD